MPDLYDIKGKKIWVAGHTGLVGSAVLRKLGQEDCKILTASHSELNLTDQGATYQWIKENKPQAIIIAAAKVGGIRANAEQPADFLFENLAMTQNIIHGAHIHDVEKILFLGSSCIYPKFAEQPIKEEALLSAPLEPTNEAYAIAKIAGIKLCQFYRRQYGRDFISLMPCNLYGPGDRWNDNGGHVIPMLIAKMHKTKIENAEFVEIWGSGKPLREFLFIDDLADGILSALRNYSDEGHLNIGSGEEISIADLAKTIRSIVGFNGRLSFDASQPDGTPRKLLDSSRMRHVGWEPKTGLEKGLKLAYEDFLISAPIV